MKTLTLEKLLPALLLTGAVVFLSISLLLNSAPKANANAAFVSFLPSVATTSTQVPVTSTTRILSTTTNALGTGTSYTRMYASICNPSAVIVYLNMNADRGASTTASVAQIGAAAGYNVCYEITDRNLYQGSVTASSTGTATLLNVQEYVQ